MLPQPRRPDLSRLVLTLSVVMYALLCLPAIGRRGFPTIDPFWLGVTYLWIFPVAFSAIFDDRGNRARRKHLFWYALATAFVDAGTLHVTTPRHVNLLGMILLTVIPYGPVHLLGTFCTEFVAQTILRRARILTDAANGNGSGLPRLSLALWFIVFSLTCLTIGLPFAYRSYELATERQRAREQADLDWHEGRAVIYGERWYVIDNLWIDSSLDPETGLQRVHRMYDRGFSDIYNQRIAELVRRNGPATNSLKQHAWSVKAVQGLMSDPDFEKIDALPFDVTPHVTLLRDGTVQRGKSTFTSGDASALAIVGKNYLTTAGGQLLPVYLRRDGELIVIRHGNEWLGVFTEDGHRIVAATQVK